MPSIPRARSFFLFTPVVHAKTHNRDARWRARTRAVAQTRKGGLFSSRSQGSRLSLGSSLHFHQQSVAGCRDENQGLWAREHPVLYAASFPCLLCKARFTNIDCPIPHDQTMKNKINMMQNWTRIKQRGGGQGFYTVTWVICDHICISSDCSLKINLVPMSDIYPLEVA